MVVMEESWIYEVMSGEICAPHCMGYGGGVEVVRVEGRIKEG